jgi:hypothetical protein
MNTPNPSVCVEAIEGFPAILMTWQHDVNKGDVVAAFQKLQTLLDGADQPIYIVVDIQSNPIFPLRETIQGALWGPYRHPRVEEWLVAGSNTLAHTIERTLSNITRRKNVRWFETEAAALGYLSTVTLGAGGTENATTMIDTE